MLQNKRIRTVVKRTLYGVVLGVCVVGSGVMALVLTAPHDLKPLVEYIQTTHAQPNMRVRVNVGEARFEWHGFNHKTGAVLHDIEVSSAEGALIGRFPQMKASLDIWSLFTLKVRPHTLRIYSPEIGVSHDAEKGWMLGLGGDAIPLAAVLGGMGGGEQSSLKIPFKHVLIEHANISITGDGDKKINFPASNIEFLQKDGHLLGGAKLVMEYQEEINPLNVQLDMIPDEQKASMRVEMQDIQPSWLCDWVSECGVAAHAKIKLSGETTVHAAVDDIVGVDFRLSGQEGEFALADHFAETIPIKQFSVAGRLSNHLKKMNIEALSVDLGQTKVEAQGGLEETDKGVGVQLTAKATDMPVNDLYKYWPTTKAPMAREWVTKRIREGMASGNVSINLTPEESVLPVLPDHALSADVQVKGVSVNYLDTFIPVKEAEGTVHFTGQSMKVVATGGKVLGAHTTNATVWMHDLNHEFVPTEVFAEVSGDAKDAAAFLQNPRFAFARDLALNPDAASGAMKGALTLKFNAYGPEGESGLDNMEYDITSELTDVSHKDFMQRFDAESFTGKLSASNTQFGFEGEGKLSGLPAKVSVHDDADKPAHYKITTTIFGEKFAEYGLPDNQYIKGPIPIDLSVTSSEKGHLVSGAADLTGAAIDIPEIDWKKPADEVAKLVFSPSEKNATRTQFSFTGTTTKASGDIALRSGNAPTSVNLASFQHGKNNLSLLYEPSADSTRIEIKGHMLDLSRHFEQQGETSISRMPPINLKLDIGQVRMSKSIPFNQVKGYLNCTSVRCEAGNITAKMGELGTPVRMSISNNAGQRSFLLRADDAGEFLRAMDIVDNMDKGVLEIKGNYDDSKKGNPLDGRIFVADFHLKDAPVLGKILNLASLTGLVNTLTGSGMGFDKLVADMVFVDDVATLKNGKAKGGSVGITAEGTVGIRTSDINMEGVLIPVYALNSFLSKIPLVGDIIIGDGLFAVNYSVKGKYTDPQVNVNPLSALAPGFLKNIFDMPDNPQPTESPADAKQREQTEEAAKMAGPEKDTGKTSTKSKGLKTSPKKK